MNRSNQTVSPLLLAACLCAAVLLSACSDPDMPVQCNAVPSCSEGFEEVAMCPDGRADDCEEVTTCGQTITCVAMEAQCTAAPSCGPDAVMVESCEGRPDCDDVTACGQTIQCAAISARGCVSGTVWVNACEDWDETCAAASGDAGGFCKEVTTAAYALDACDYTVSAGETPEASTTAVLTAFVEALAGEVVCLENGYYAITEQLALTEGIEVRGESMEGVILDFAGQETGANGILAQPSPGSPIIFTPVTVKNTGGDAIRVEKAEGVTFRYVTATWDGGPDRQNGAYGLYPVQSEDVLIEYSKAFNASDAGIYVGQSSNIIVRHNEAAFNVAGVEIENSSDADVHDNDVHDNTGGVLVFNLPNLDVKTGARAKVHHNTIMGNNTANFAPPQNIVAQVPAGSGVLIIAADDTEVHDNVIRDNKSTAVTVLSYQTTTRSDYREDEAYDPYGEGAWIHDNTMEMNAYAPPSGSLVGLIKLLSGIDTLEDMLWDGFVDADKPVEQRRNCWSNNTRADGTTPATWRNFDAPNFPDDTSGQTDELGDHGCTKTALPRVTIPGVSVDP